MKRKGLIIATIILLNTLIFPFAHADENIKVNLNEKPILFDATPYVKDGRTLVPFRKVLEAFSAEVNWDSEQKVISARNSDTEIFMQIGTNYAFVNGNKVSLDVAPEITSDRTFIPLRFISENLGAEVKWDAPSSTINITYLDNIYTLGQEGKYNNLIFSIDKVDTSSQSEIKINGKLNDKTQELQLEVADDLGYSYPTAVALSDQNSGVYPFEGSVGLPSCHNFIASKVIVKLITSDQKFIKLGTYKLN